MKIYIAGKITGLPRAKVVAKFNAARRHLKAQGHDVFIPTVLPYYKSVPHEDYMHVCFGMIDICDAIYLLSDWHESRGATMERLYAADTLKKIIYQEEPPVERQWQASADEDYTGIFSPFRRYYFIGLFNSYDELKAYNGDKTHNDYAFVRMNDDTERPVYNRYIWNAIKQKWQFQYSLCEPFFHENKLALIEK